MPTYAGWLKLDIVGLAAGQVITDTVYYGGENGEGVLWNPALMESVAAGWLASFGEDWLGEHPDVYSLQKLVARVLDNHGVTVSENAVEVATSGTGDVVAPCAGVAQVAILPFQTIGVETEAARNLKRSYIAFGPIPAVWINPDNTLTATAITALGTILAVLGNTLTVLGVEYWPVRLGKTAPTAQPALGTITTVSIDPVHSFRRSRLQRANGS